MFIQKNFYGYVFIKFPSTDFEFESSDQPRIGLVKYYTQNYTPPQQLNSCQFLQKFQVYRLSERKPTFKELQRNLYDFSKI